MNTLQSSYSTKIKTTKYAAVIVILTLLLVVLFFTSCFLGSVNANAKNAFTSLLDGNFSNVDFRIIFYLRLPRALAAILSGAALAVSGVILQAVLNNPMAAPNVIGVNAGAGFAATLTISLFPASIAIMPISAFFGALCACLFIYVLSVKTGAGRLTITLVGIAVGSVLNAGVNTLKVVFPDSVYDADMFMIGGFSGMTYNKLRMAAVIIAVSMVLVFMLAKYIDILCLGETTAKTLGMNVGAIRLILLIIASALAGAAVSFSGLLGFVGLLVPHITRKLVGNRHRLLVPSTALFGAVLVLFCDIISRIIFAPFELPVGIVLSVVGGIFFICLVMLSKRDETL